MAQMTKTQASNGKSSFWTERLGRLLWNAGSGFWNDDCYAKAAMLTFYTLQSIVPLLAALLGFAQGFGLDEYFKGLIIKGFSEQKEILGYALHMADLLLTHIKSGVIAGLGVLFLLWTGLSLASAIETAFSDIWHVRAARGFFRRFKDFLAAIILCPIIFVASSSMTVYIRTQLSSLDGSIWYQPISVSGIFLLKFVPLILSCLLFFLLYYFIPQVRVRIWPRIVGAICAGIAFQLWQWVYIHFQVQIWNYSAVFGTFAIIPLFLVWVQFSWLIALAGAELAAAIESESLYQGKDHHTIEKISRRELALVILYKCLDRWHSGQAPVQLLEISHIAQLPVNELAQMVGKLEKAGVLVVVHQGDSEMGYCPGRDPSTITVKEVCDIVGNDPEDISVIASPAVTAVREVVERLDQASDHSIANIKLSQLVKR